MEPFTKKYSKKELESCSLIRLRFATSGIDNPKNNITNENEACALCKAGRKIEHLIHIPVNRMGKKRIDINDRYGFIIIEKELAQMLKIQGLKGFDLENIVMGRDKNSYQELKIKNSLPKMSEKSSVHKYQICPKCGRSGHYDNYETETRFKYDKTRTSNLNSDFFLTWEYFGIWDMGQTSPQLVISNKAYKFLRELKLRHLIFDPVDLI